jgi:threonine synthase
MDPFKCTNCGRPQAFTFGGGPCPVCGGVLGLAAPLTFDPASAGPAPGLWRFAHTLPLPPGAAPVTLGEGGTQLLPVPVAGSPGDRQAFLKLESAEPTGSFKDRGMAVMFTPPRAAGHTQGGVVS